VCSAVRSHNRHLETEFYVTDMSRDLNVSSHNTRSDALSSSDVESSSMVVVGGGVGVGMRLKSVDPAQGGPTKHVV